MKNMFSAKDAQKMIARINQLDSSALPRWGVLNVAGMLYHCALVNEAIFKGRSTVETSLKQQLKKILVLRIVRRIPRNAKSNPKFFAANQNLSFEDEKQHLIRSMQQFSQPAPELTAQHPAFGKMQTKEWGRFAWIHLDHHLHQFRV